MASIGSTTLAGKYKDTPWFWNQKKNWVSALPRPYRRNVLTRNSPEDITNKVWFKEFIDVAETYVIKHLL